MKTIKQALTNWSRTAATASGCMLLSVGLNAAAQPFASPVGDWDVVMSGSRQGVARFTFNSDHTFTVTEILIPKNLVTRTDPKTVDASRGGDIGRDGTAVTNITAVLPPHTNLYGFVGFPSSELNFTNGDGNAIWVHDGVPAGQWNFDLNGKVVGFFTEISSPLAITTNYIPIGTPIISDCQDVVTMGSNGQPVLVQVCVTNQPILTNVEVLRLTNGASFTAKVTLDTSDFLKSRMTMVASTPAGKATFNGLIPIVLPDISGDWFGIKNQAGLPYNEFFTTGAAGPLNMFNMDGSGPGYNFDGGLLVVRQKKFGFVVDITRPHDPPPDGIQLLKIRVVTGPVDLTNGKLSGNGLEDTETTPDRIKFKAALLPPASE